MSFRIHKLSYQEGDFKIEKASWSDLLSAEQDRLNDIESRIIELYLSKQEGRVGITGLGNTLRYDSDLKALFSRNAEYGFCFTKLTENKRAFSKVFLSALHDCSSLRKLFVILDPEFGRTSQLVDGSFTTVESIQLELDVFSKIFEPKFDSDTIYFAELFEFGGYATIEYDGSDLTKRYTKLLKL